MADSLFNYVLFGDETQPATRLEFARVEAEGEEAEKPLNSVEKRSRAAYEAERNAKPLDEFVHPGGKKIVALPEVHTNMKETVELDASMPKLPFAMCAVANQQTGKGTMLINMLLSPDMMKGVFKKIWLIATTAFKDGQWEYLKIPDDQKALSYSASFGKRINDFAYDYKEQHGKFPLQLVIYDDILSVSEGEFNATKAAIEASATSWRHANISMFVSAQSFNMLSSIGRQNMTAWVVFRMRSSDGFDRFAKENLPIDTKLTPYWFRAMYDWCVNGKGDEHSFMYINTRGSYRSGDKENTRYFKNFEPIPIEVLESFSSLRPYTIAWMHEQRIKGQHTKQQYSDLKFHEFDQNKIREKYYGEEKRLKYEPVPGGESGSTVVSGSGPQDTGDAAQT